MFVVMGGRLFRGFAIILLSWFGIKVALSAFHEHHAFHFGNFASLLLTIAFGMITYFDSPILALAPASTRYSHDLSFAGSVINTRA